MLKEMGEEEGTECKTQLELSFKKDGPIEEGYGVRKILNGEEAVLAIIEWPRVRETKTHCSSLFRVANVPLAQMEHESKKLFMEGMILSKETCSWIFNNSLLVDVVTKFNVWEIMIKRSLDFPLRGHGLTSIITPKKAMECSFPLILQLGHCTPHIVGWMQINPSLGLAAA